MKKILFLATIIGLTAIMYGCPGNENSSTLQVSTPAEVPMTGGTVTFNITIDSSWEITKTAQWFSIEKTAGMGNATVEVVVDPNTDEARSGRITVKAGGQTKDVTLRQEGVELTAELPAAVAYEGGSTSFKVIANVSWTISPSSISWITSIEPKTGEPGTTTVTVIGSRNPGSRRTGTIKVVGGGRELSVPLVQMGDPEYNVTIDDLVGEWSGTLNYINMNVEPLEATQYGYVATFRKLDETTLSIHNFMNLGEITSGETYCDNNVIMTFDYESQTVSVPVQAMEPSFDEEGIPIYLYPFNVVNEEGDTTWNPQWNDKTGYKDVPIVNLTIDFALGLEQGKFANGDPLITSFVILGQDPSDGTVYSWNWYMANMSFSKTTFVGAPQN